VLEVFLQVLADVQAICTVRNTTQEQQRQHINMLTAASGS
jgi:hypothetical protein